MVTTQRFRSAAALFAVGCSNLLDLIDALAIYLSSLFELLLQEILCQVPCSLSCLRIMVFGRRIRETMFCVIGVLLDSFSRLLCRYDELVGIFYDGR